MADIVTEGVETAESRRKAQETEYGTWVATEAISINGTLAFNAGDPVPVSHVEAYPDLEAQGFVKRAEKVVAKGKDTAKDAAPASGKAGA